MLANALVQMHHFDYCCTVWSNCYLHLSDSLQILHRLVRILPHADIRTNIAELMHSLNWCKLEKRPENQLLSIVFKGTNVLHQTFQVCHVCCNFVLGYICRMTVNFGTRKDESLLINIFASNNCFSNRIIFQNGVDALSKINDAFFTKS